MPARSDPVDPPAFPKDRILQASQRLFYSDGVRATGVDRLIAEEGA